ncbi:MULTISPECIES: transporter substrate-binding domain-containing protein [unclassified Microbacterium]|uniref:transporter substrate-binding domain-containing protein n=1 Tax=unclassified Microbacterium TaxID=2609290 RepID=UPI00214ABA6D|nr:MULTISPECIES: transporter substrate-binding domain-containing protein [unclassified Microbacterium]MCR2810525.1 transporter substrate-binding domain-containing protein [Microbacterium sp. zg.B185]WIM19511.1 transporter substrate-binding domain-containing protein [Microbacterium sp. zg-B185]
MKLQTRAVVSTLAVAATAAMITSCAAAAPTDEAPEITTLTVGMSWPYEPWQVGDGTTVKDGIEPELLAAIGEKLDITFDIQNVDFTGIVTGTQSGKYDLAVSGLGVYGDRLKALNFIPDAKTGYTMVINAEDEDLYTTIGDLCGVEVAVLNATKSYNDIELANATTEDDGSDWYGVCKDEPITFQAYDDQAGQDLAFSTGKVDVGLLTEQVAASYVEKSGGDYLVVEPYSYVPFGIGIPKEETELAEMLLKAFKEVVADGTYLKILEKYGQADSALTADEIVLLTD